MPGSSASRITKKIHFYRVFLFNKRMPHVYPEWSWAEKFSSLDGTPLSERTKLGVIYEPEVLESISVLGMHKPLKPDFMSYLPEHADLTQSVFDIFAEEDSNEPEGSPAGEAESPDSEKTRTPADELTRFAHSSVACFLDNGVVGLCTSSNSAPQTRALVNFLNDFFPEANMEWRCEPYIVEGDLRKFQNESTGVRKANFKFVTSRDLLTPEERRSDSTSFTESFDHIADGLGGDFQVEVSISILPGSNSRQTRQRLRDSIRSSLDRLVAAGSKLKVTADRGSGLTEEELDILQHKLSHSIEIQTASLESKRFDILKREVAGHCKEVQLPVD